MNDLGAFVLGYVREVGGLAEPAGPERHEVIIPDNLARQWGVSAYQYVTFGEATASVPAAESAVTRLSYNHLLVEAMIEEARTQPASTQFHINDLRLDKKGLDDLARSSWGLPNARVVSLPQATIRRVLGIYVRFNFKAVLLSDDKQEQLVSVLMDAHSGYAAANPSRIYQAASPDRTDPVLNRLIPGPIRWATIAGQATGPLTPAALEILLSRAQNELKQTMAESLTQLQRRSRRFHELDEARLNEYYDEIERDLKQRQSSALSDRRASLEEKLATISAERVAKLADAAERYRVSLNLTLLNVMVISQPKLVLAVGVENRSSKIETYAVWDPLLHRLEPLACEVCGQAGQQTFLCQNGHLAHEQCLAPACIDCKRVFCADCAEDVGRCDVCQQPLCRHSRITCPECGRGTCQTHVDMCHANQGRPVDLRSTPTPSPEPEPLPEPEPAQSTVVAKSKKTSSKNKRVTKSKAVTQRRIKPQLPKGMPKPQRIEVVVGYDTIVAYLLASKERQLAHRAWILRPDEGIIVSCQCEKGAACPADNRLIRPANKAALAQQLLNEINSFRQEYGLPSKKVNFHRQMADQPLRTRRLLLSGLWNDESALRAAQAAFNRMYR